MKRRWWWMGAIAGAFVAGAGAMLWEAARARQQAAVEVADARRIGYTVRDLDRRLPPFDPVSGAGAFTDAAFFNGRVYVSTPAALQEYDADGTPRRRWRSGLELPGARLGPLATAQQALYLGTYGAGIIIFDGRSLRQILPDNPACGKITAILPLSSGRIVLGTLRGGVLALDGEHLTPFHQTLDKLQVTALAGDLASMWIGTGTDGVYHWKAGVVEHTGVSEGLPDPAVTSLAGAGDRVFVGTPMGIAEIGGGRVQRSFAPGFFATALLPAGDTLLAGSLNEGIVEIPLAAHRPRSARAGFSFTGGVVTRLFEIGGAPVAVAAKGLFTADASAHGWKQTIVPEAARLTDSNISALAVDAAGRLWAGYFDRGLDVVDGERVLHFEDDSVFCVNRIVPGPLGRGQAITAVATANGLVLFDAAPARRQVLRRADGLIADHVTDVAFTPAGMVLATPAGITTIDAAGTHSVSDFHGLVNQHVYTIAAREQELLAGTLGGLSVLHGEIVQANYTTFNSRLRDNWITAIQAAGEDWFVGTYGAGVMRLRPNGGWDAWADLKGSIVINPNAMLVTAAHVFAGSLENGLLVYDRSGGRWHAVVDGLPSVNVTALASAGGTIYIGTDNGLVRVAEDRIP